MTVDDSIGLSRSSESRTEHRGEDVDSRLILFSHEMPSGEVSDLIRRLHRWAKSPRYPRLARFLRECTAALIFEARKLPRPLRDDVPPFDDVVTLASHWEQLQQSPLCSAWEGAYLCIFEIGMLIGHHETFDIDYSPGGTDHGLPTIHLAGLSVGLFSAAAAAVSCSLWELASQGAEAVRVAFAFCVHVGRVSQQLETTVLDAGKPDLKSVSWAHLVMGVPVGVVQAELDLFNGLDSSGGKTTALTRVTVSHVDGASVGITGPPSHLAQLFRHSKVLSSSRHNPLRIPGGLCHVSNVYGVGDVHDILKSADVRRGWGSRSLQAQLLSPCTGTPFSAADGAQLIEAICTEALTEPLHFDKLAEGVLSQLLQQQPQSSPAVSCNIMLCRSSQLSHMIISHVTEKHPSANLPRRSMVDWAMLDEPAPDEPRGCSTLPQNSKLAVVGMSCRLPGGADTPDKFWEILKDGVDTHTTIPPDRFDLEAHFDPSGKTTNAIETRFGNFIENPGYFDAAFFNMSPREAEQTDPMQRLALLTAYEALEMAGFVPNRTPSSNASRVGCFYGQASDDYREVNASQRVGTYGIPGTERAFGNGRINYFFNLQGPSFNVDTACSSGLAAVQAACSALWAGEADTVVAGGLNVITSPDIYCMLGKGHFLSTTGQCKVWDAGADGYCRGDGVGSVVIKRLNDAIADNDNVLATILSAATNHSAESASITQPHTGAQRDNYRLVLNKAGVDPLDVSFVELHGTGTQVGDAIESESVVGFFAPAGRRQRPDQRLHLGAVKSNIGHGEAAAGVASLIKVLLMYRHGVVPRHVGIRGTMNPVVARHLADRNAGVLLESRPWLPMSSQKKRYSVVNSFGAHGGNTTLLLEDPPSPCTRQADNGHNLASETATCQVICISAKSRASLRGNVGALLGYLDAHPQTDLGSLSYTLCARRMHHHIRLAVSVPDKAELGKFLQSARDNIDVYAKHAGTATPPSVVFAFSGQGCFYRGAAAVLFQRAPAFREIVTNLDRVVLQLGYPSVLTSISGHVASHWQSDSGTDEAISSPHESSSTGSGSDGSSITAAETDSAIVSQLGLLVVEIALSQYWQLLGIHASVVIGHSLGEYAAMVVAGVLSVADAIFLVGRRAQLMMAACRLGSHAMLSVRGASIDEVARLCRASGSEYHYEVSCINTRTDTVLSGSRDDMSGLLGVLQDAGLRCVLLDLPFAFHSAQMDPILDDYENAAGRVTFKPPRIPIASPLLGKCIVGQQPLVSGAYLRRATREPVDFVAALDAAERDGLVDDKTVWIDVGPHPVCTSFSRAQATTDATRVFATLQKGDHTLSTLTTGLAALHCLGLRVEWNEYFAPNERAYRLLHLDPYQWNLKNYWIPYEGTWTLDKAHAGPKTSLQSAAAATPSFLTSSVQQILSKELGEISGRLLALSSLSHPDLKAAANGHKINGKSVLTASIWADVAFTIGEYMYKGMMMTPDRPHMDVRDMKVSEAQMLDDHGPSATSLPPEQFILVEADTDREQRETQVNLYTASADGLRKSQKPFATAVVAYENGAGWEAEWQAASHLVSSRAHSLWAAGEGAGDPGNSIISGGVSKLSRGATYELFANIVEYGPQYRGMQRVALAQDSLEAVADVVLDPDRHGTWHTPPHWIDGAFQLAGFVMNSFGARGEGAAAGSSRDFFYITPGWRHLRISEPLAPGPDVTYRNYVHIFPEHDEPGTYSGDIYLLRQERVVGVCAGIKFKRVPRKFMPSMFPRVREARPSVIRSRSKGNEERESRETAKPYKSAPQAAVDVPQRHNGVTAQVSAPPPPPPSDSTQQQGRRTNDSGHQGDLADACLELISEETGLDRDDLKNEALFADLGVDSLMSLALSEKMRAGLGINVQASVFLEYPTVGEFMAHLEK